jgi:hypothetical protein
VWVGTALNGLAKFDGATWTTYNTANSSIPGNSIYSLKYNVNTNKLWVGTQAGLGVLATGTNSWTVYTSTNSGLAGNYVRGVSFLGNTNIAWIATGASGISRYDGTNWTTFNMANSNLPNNAVWSIKANANGSVWAATQGGGVVKTVDITTGIAQQEKEIREINIYPNPNSGEFTIEYNYSDSPELVITNLLGQTFYHQALHSGSNTISQANLAKGYYIYKVQNSNVALTGKIIVE